LIAFILLIYILLWLPPVQQKIKEIALSEISKKTHNQMRIGKLSFRPFNRLKLEDVYVQDLKGDTLLYANKLAVSCRLFRLLNNQLEIRSVDLDDFVIRINKDNPDADFNFQFFIDAFESEKQDTTSSSGMPVQIRNISLKNGRLFYDVLSEPASDAGLFDVNHIHIFDFRAAIDLKSIDLEHPDVAVKQFSFTEQSGFNLKQLQAGITSGKQRIHLKNFRLQLPRSELTIPEAYVDYTGLTPGKLLESGLYFLQFGKNHIFPGDLQMFYPPLSGLSRDLTFTGLLEGTFPAANIPQLTMDYGEHIRLNINAFMADFRKWDDTQVRLDLERLSANASGIRELLGFISQEEKIQLPVNTGSILLTGNLNGTLPDMAVRLKAKTDRGSLHLNGSGGYNRRSGLSKFDAQLDADNFDLQTLLQDTLFGAAGFQVKAQGIIGHSGNTNISGTATISRLDFNRYPYHRIRSDITYSGDTLRLNLDSEDPNVPLTIRGTADFSSPAPGFQLYARLDSVFLDSLHFLSNYKDAYLSSVIRADLKGIDPEKMKLSLTVDRFLLRTNKGSFEEKQLQLDYLAADSSRKVWTVFSNILNSRLEGNFTYAGVEESLVKTFPLLFPETKIQPQKKDTLSDNFFFALEINQANSLSDILELPKEIPDSAIFAVQYSRNGEMLKLSANAFTQFQKSDTLWISLSLANKQHNNLSFVFNVDNRSNNYDFDGSIDADVEFIPKTGSFVPDVHITLNPTVLILNGTDFNLQPARIEIQDNRYIINDLLLSHNTTEYVKVDGIISDLPDDSLKINVSGFQLETIFGAVKTEIPLSGKAQGEIVTKNLLSTPLLFSRKFDVNDILFAGNEVGNLTLRSAWSSERKGLVLRATLAHENHPPSVVSGVILPEKDSLYLSAEIRDLELKWLNSFTEGALYGLDGSLNGNLKLTGKIQDPDITGVAYFDSAQVGITVLNTLYSIRDSLYLTPGQIELKRFTIKDKYDNALRANGKITHRLFSDFNPNVSLSLSNFLVINNEHQTDSLFYGRLRVNGLLNLKQMNKDWVLSGDVTHSNDSRVMVNVPSSASTAERYNNITFLHTEEENPEEDTPSGKKTNKKPVNSAFPLKINVSLWLDPSLTVGAVFNPLTKDAAQVTGNGSMNFAYDLKHSDINLSGDYVIESGKATLSLVNITKKTFTVQEGGKLTFRGNPMATTFNLIALYNLRADLTALDPSFQSLGLSSTKVPVSCSLTAEGSIDKMSLKYDILFPSEQEEIKRKVNSLLYTDDLKIKEIAYLLAFGAFMPVNADDTQPSNHSIWTSLASSSITGQLNNLLSSVLSENWSIGTNLHTKDSNFSTVDMDVNISTHLFDNRLTFNSTFGYHNDPAQTENFTGDFDLEYKLNSSGNVVLKAYNATNNQYYERAKTTQGIGIAYKRNARTFKQLFDKFKKKKKKGDETNQ
jgi:hypothetical protein